MFLNCKHYIFIENTICQCFGPASPQPTSKFVLRVPNPEWWCKKTQGLYWFGQCVPYVLSEKLILYSLHRNARSRGLQAGRERELVLGLYVERRGLLEMLISSHEGACVFIYAFVREFVEWA